MPTNAHRTRWNPTGGPWGTGLLLLGVGLTVQGIAYMCSTADELRSALAWINQGVPVRGWALLWIGAGLYSMVKALNPPQRHIDLAPGVGVVCLWGGVYAVYWLMLGICEGVWTRDWTTAVAWGVLACVLISFGRCVNPPRRIHR